MKEIYKNRSYVSLLLGTFISNMGDHMYNIAITLGLYNLTGDILSIAYMWLVRALLRIPVQFLAGIISDRRNRRNTIVLINLISAPIACLLIFVNEETIFIAIIVVFLLQGLNDIESISSTSLVPLIVGKEELAEANGGFSILSTVSGFVAPAVAGVIYKVFRIELIYIINGITFLVSGIIFMNIKYKHIKVEKEHEFKLIHFAKEGFQKVKDSRSIFNGILIFIPFALLGRYYEIFKVVVADDNLGIGGEGIIYFGYAMAIGGLISPKIIGEIKKRYGNDNYRRLYSSGLILVSLGYIGWIFSSNIFVSLICIGVISIGSALAMMALRIMIQGEIEKEYLGRVMSFQKIVMISSAIIGIILAPVLKGYLGIRITVLIPSLLGILLSGFYFLRGDEKREVSI